VSRISPNENDRDKSLVAKIVFDEDLTPALDGIEEWSHIHVIFWQNKVIQAVEPELRHQGSYVGFSRQGHPFIPIH